MKLATRHRVVLVSIFRDPVSANIAWSDVEGLMAACGAQIEEGRGSRVRVALNGVRAVFHRPHPAKETNRGAVRAVRRFFVEAGVVP